ncbi:hypothetical protein O0I10_002352 [Lichtheimia ornata]|uniref:DOC domain-containing protein n=1 Tax=Lichtheimia ornata TaxID=688661 RepID=A0AAD7VCZ4_9FUNG|nr:uncharacterized protein O0I10_002352 [Lichtheimia ornata]KAJ8662021.1 hypothetical protein O0I10_002352 [Lichtheimia ornata]
MSDDREHYGNLFPSDDEGNSSDNTIEQHAPSGYMDLDEDLRDEEEEEEEEDVIDDEGHRLDDSAREKNAMQIYTETHPDLEQKSSGGREIAEHEAIWSVSTYREDWGVEKLRDNNPLTYWQSNCPNPKAPHTVDLYFHHATFIKQVSIFIDFYQDESYTPKHISIRGGITYRDLHEITSLECEGTVGWQNADLVEATGEPVRLFHLQIAILNTHLNGRDTHIRQLKVYSVLPQYLTQKPVPERIRGLR